MKFSVINASNRDHFCIVNYVDTEGVPQEVELQLDSPTDDDHDDPNGPVAGSLRTGFWRDITDVTSITASGLHSPKGVNKATNLVRIKWYPGDVSTVVILMEFGEPLM